MKAKSTKMRFWLMLQTLLKHTDSKHRMNSVVLNDYLRPHGLECTSRVLKDAMKVFREMGVDARCKGAYGDWGVWLEEGPISNANLKRIIFSVATNPYLSNEQATEILQSLKPFVSVYKEPLLQSTVENKPHIGLPDVVFEACTVVQEALDTGRRVRFTVRSFVYDETSPTGFSEKKGVVVFTPKCLYRGTRAVYAVGYNHKKNRVDAIDLSMLVKAELASNVRNPHEDYVREVLLSAEPKDYVSGEPQKPIYVGPAEFRCRGQYMGVVFSMFGPPEGVVKRDVRKWSVFRVQEVEIRPETLLWIAGAPGHAVRIVGPDGLTEAVMAYCDNTAKITCRWY